MVREFRSWGKHLLIELEDVSVRIHLLLFGSYRINERKDSTPRLSLGFADGELNFYACSVQLIEGPLDAAYDWSMDVMSAVWSPRGTLKRLREHPRLLACDALLDQTLFAGSGNIIKNEVLYRIRVHPLSLIGELPPAKLRELVREARTYSFQFLEWKRAGVLKANWLAHGKNTCVRCRIPLVKAKELGAAGAGRSSASAARSATAMPRRSAPISRARWMKDRADNGAALSARQSGSYRLNAVAA